MGSHSLLRSSEPLALTRAQAEEHNHSSNDTNEETDTSGYATNRSGSQTTARVVACTAGTA